MQHRNSATLACMALLICLALSAHSHAQTFTSLLSFNEANGDNPYGTLVQGANGNFYGTTSSDFGSGYGTIFEITAEGALTTLYSFCSLPNCADGSYPVSGLTLARDGNFYGLTNNGGSHGDGTFFRITPEGTLTTLYSFCSEMLCADGYGPVDALIQAANGNFYGATAYGGATGYGTLFEMSPVGRLTTLYNFCSKTNCIDGSLPFGTLLQLKNGTFYGTTYLGGANGDFGTIFKMSGGKFTTIYSFCAKTNCSDGFGPYGGLVLGKSGNFYGTTGYGGTVPTACNGQGCGTIFQLTRSNQLITLHNFCSSASCVDGELPTSALISASNGNLYGTTAYGGTHCISGGTSGCGTIFGITPTGSFTVLHSFDSTDGYDPQTSLLQASDGTLYGTTISGGSFSWGTIFSYVPK
jgi:uncharacterized repeat protein (TIGR03803 family)